MAPYVTPEILLTALTDVCLWSHWRTDPAIGPAEDTLACYVAKQLGFDWPVDTVPGEYASTLHFLAENQEGWFTLQAHDMWEEMTDLALRGFEWGEIADRLEEGHYVTDLAVPF